MQWAGYGSRSSECENAHTERSVHTHIKHCQSRTDQCESNWNSMMQLHVKRETNPSQWGMTASQSCFWSPWAPPQDREQIKLIIRQTTADELVWIVHRRTNAECQPNAAIYIRMVLRAVKSRSARASWMTSVWWWGQKNSRFLGSFRA